MGHLPIVGELRLNLPRLARVVSDYNADLYASMSNPGSVSKQKTRNETEDDMEPPNNQQLTPEETVVSQIL
jgi:hypothetical protein